jgi:predicted RNase H-like HicB family nuclease
LNVLKIRHLENIEREGDGFVALCPELDVASQGDSIEEAKKNLQEALELFFDAASSEEIKTRLHIDVHNPSVWITSIRI